MQHDNYLSTVSKPEAAAWRPGVLPLARDTHRPEPKSPTQGLLNGYEVSTCFPIRANVS